MCPIREFHKARRAAKELTEQFGPRWFVMRNGAQHRVCHPALAIEHRANGWQYVGRWTETGDWQSLAP